ncbi:MAG: PHP domain-containing protein [Methanobacteriota archaeon]|nr:MAG: PHP domain-containing protein [Euryarchaeota archaeon]
MTRMDFHIHSDYSDGTASLEDIVTEALRWRLEAIGIVDHVRGDADWLADRQRQIDELRGEHGDELEIFSGIEVKVRDEEGALNVLPQATEKVDFVIASFHGVPRSVEERMEGGDRDALVDWWHSCTRILLDCGHDAHILGHPDRILVDRALSVGSARMKRLVEQALASRMFLEWNPAAAYPVQPFATALAERGAPNVTYGSDAHSTSELTDALRARTDYEAGIVERGNQAFLSILREDRGDLS